MWQNSFPAPGPLKRRIIENAPAAAATGNGSARAGTAIAGIQNPYQN